MSYMLELAEFFVSPLYSPTYFPTRVSLCVKLKRKYMRAPLCSSLFWVHSHQLIVSDSSAERDPIVRRHICLLYCPAVLLSFATPRDDFQI
jgi:hypothetical protein